MRLIAFGYGLVCYAVFFGTFLYAIAFVGNLPVPYAIDAAPPGSGPETGTAGAVLIDLLLLTVFAVQHSVMARPSFKRWWTKIVPKPIERSTYVLFASLALILLFWQWRPIPMTIWSLEGPMAIVMMALFWTGWGIVLISTFLISHFELFGLQQVWMNLRQKKFADPVFHTPYLYGLVRHPIYLGFIIAFWSAPHMTAGHLLFAVVTLAYILVAIQFEERDLITLFGEKYLAYKKRVSMLLPIPKAKAGPENPQTPAVPADR
jgi:protein-S-isoprenylcysteine O-methyltransferase Ste14